MKHNINGIDYELAEKAWEINLDKINEGYLYSDEIVYADNRNDAKTKLKNKINFDDYRLKSNDEYCDYITIPVIRCKGADKYFFEDKKLTEYEIIELLHKQKRIKKLDDILNDDSIGFCYIMKRGSYYRSGYSGYTEIKEFAGVYNKEDAISHAKGCDEIYISPINNAEHNEMINKRIDELKNKLIYA